MTDGDTILRVASLEAVCDAAIELTKVSDWVVVLVEDVQEAEVAHIVLWLKPGLANGVDRNGHHAVHDSNY